VLLEKTKGDRWIWLIIILLSMISILAVYSATGTLAFKQGKTVEKLLLTKHLIFVIMGIGMIYIAHLLDYKYYAGISKILMIVTIPLLFYTLIFGASLNDASRWVKIPFIGLTFQTSDLAKLALITFLARMLTKKQENIKDVKTSFIPIMGSVCLVFVLIALANLSTALMLFGVSILLLIIGRISIKQIMFVCAGGFVLLMFVFSLVQGGKPINRVSTRLSILSYSILIKLFRRTSQKLPWQRVVFLVKDQVTAHSGISCPILIRILFSRSSWKNMDCLAP